MNSLEVEARTRKVWFDEENLWLLLYDGRQLSVPLSFFPRLLHATAEQRANLTISGGGTGLHWDEIDEDISVRGLLLGYGNQTVDRKNQAATG